MRTDGVHRRESDGTEPVFLKVARDAGVARTPAYRTVYTCGIE